MNNLRPITGDKPREYDARAAIEALNKRLTDEIAPALRAEVVAEVKSTLDDAKRVSFQHGHAEAMAKSWRYLVGGASAGFLAAVLVYGMAVMTGGYIARMEGKNAQIERQLVRP